MNLELANWPRTTRFTHPLPTNRDFWAFDDSEHSHSDSDINEDTANEKNDNVVEEAKKEDTQ